MIFDDHVDFRFLGILDQHPEGFRCSVYCSRIFGGRFSASMGIASDRMAAQDCRDINPFSVVDDRLFANCGVIRDHLSFAVYHDQDIFDSITIRILIQSLEIRIYRKFEEIVDVFNAIDSKIFTTDPMNVGQFTDP